MHHFSAPKRLAFFAIPGFALAACVFVLLDLQVVFEPPWLLPILNTVFLSGASFFVAYIAARGYRASGAPNLLFFGSAVLTYGAGSLVAGWVIGAHGSTDAAVTLHSTAAAVGGMLHLVSGLLVMNEDRFPVSARGRRRALLATYLGVVASLALLAAASLRGLTPPFFIPGIGFTPLRQVTLGIAVAGFAASALLVAGRYRALRSDFLYWSTLALVLLAVGLGALFFQRAVGSPVGWIGRSAQYLGCVYFLIAAIHAVREVRRRRLPLERAVAALFHGARENYQALVEAVADPIVAFDQEGRVLLWNAAAERAFGYPRDEAFGAPLIDLIGLRGEGAEGAPGNTPTEGVGTLLAVGANLQAEARRKDGTFFPVELSVSRRETGERWIGTMILRDITARHAAEKALNASEARYRIVADNTYSWEFWIDPQGGVLYCSPSCEGLTGYTARELAADPALLLRLAHPEDREPFAAHWQDRARGAPPCHLEFRLVRKDGTLRWINHVCQPLYDTERRFLGTRGSNQDITDRKRAEDELTERTIQLDAVRAIASEISRELVPDVVLRLIIRRAVELVRAASGGVHLWDDEDQVLVTRAWHGHGEWVAGRRLRLGEGVAGMVAKTREGLIVNDYRTSPYATPLALANSRVSAVLGAPLLYRERLLGVITVETADGQRRFNEADLERLTLLAHHAAIAIENARLYSETDRRRREVEVLADLIHGVSASLDLDTTLHAVVDGARELCAADLTQVALWDKMEGALRYRSWAGNIGEAFRDLRVLPGRGVGGTVWETGRPFRTAHYGEDRRISGDYVSVAESEGLLAMIAVPIRMDGKAEGVLYVSRRSPRPFTDRDEAILLSLADQAGIALRNAQQFEALREHAQTLERRVRERTADLETTNRELEAFAYSVSHDLRAPLRAIDGFSKILHEEHREQLDSEARRVLGIIRKNTEGMGALIDDLLALSRVGRTEVRKTRVDMTTLAASAFREVYPAPSGPDGVDFRVAPLTEAYGDPGLLQQVWINLLSNAVKFSAPKTRPIVEVAELREPDRVVYLVKDNGVGFDMRYAHKLFGVFQRLHRADEFTGTGVGLALTQRIVHRHGGGIWADAAVGEGATFFFTLPGRENSP